MSASPNVIEVSLQNFQSEVVEKSKQLPVLLEFYAAGAEPSDQLAPVLRRLADEYNGKFLLARVDIRENSQMVQQLGVRTLPSLKLIHDGQLAQELEGPQAADEKKLREILDQVTMSPAERVQEQIRAMLEAGDRQGAIAMLQQAISEEPNNHALHTELSDLLIMEGRVDEAKQILAGLPADANGIEKPKSRLAFIEESEDLPSVDELTRQLEGDEDNLKLRYNLAIRLVVDDQI
ncbi:MAG: thioredoxin domain-containing protein, partial [Pseudomonadales bacterium]